ncbi:hypothetical protein CEQ90_07490 [Lewinellaceae bacterium SD302]|nr:hypothetical protein CEQ90_07490 [Lewinellaceae bacterium SD302]
MQYLYRENQKFNQWWLWLLMLGTLGLAIWSGYEAYAGTGDLAPFIVAALVGGLTAISLAVITLRTTVTKEGIEIALLPFSKRRIFRSEIERAFVREYSPIREYGGWGYRIGAAGKAYNVSGKFGLQLVLKDGEKILVGTQQPEALEELMTGYLEDDISEEMLELKALEAQKLKQRR